MEAGSTPPFEGGVVQNVELEEVEVYITWRQNTGARYIATWLILELCEEAEQRTGVQVSKRWQEQESIILDRAQVVVTTTAQMEHMGIGSTGNWYREDKCRN